MPNVVSMRVYTVCLECQTDVFRIDADISDRDVIVCPNCRYWNTVKDLRRPFMLELAMGRILPPREHQQEQNGGHNYA